VWEGLERGVDLLTAGIQTAAQEAGVPIYQTRLGTMFSTFFTLNPVYDWPTASRSDTKLFGRFFRGMLEGGVYLAPSQFEAAFFSTAHSLDVIDETLQTARNVMKSIR
jgi:glutamate-1-semialdehyde 2,1-aminomutase